jgi:hypothetical protein
MSTRQQQHQILESAASVWEELGLPAFLVDGHMDGKYREYTVPEVLRVAAERLRLQQAQIRESVGVAA